MTTNASPNTHLRRPAILLASALLSLAGCGNVDLDAHHLMDPGPLYGRWLLVQTGNGQVLEEKGRIDARLRIPRTEVCEMDLWIIRARMPRPADPNRPTERPRGTVVLLHPMSTSKAWFLSLGEKLADRGWDVVLPDLRGHGYSDGDIVTWGAMEKHDVKAIMDRLLTGRSVHEPVYALGASLGGCVAIQYAAIDPRCRGVLAIAPPTGIAGAARLMFDWSKPDYVAQVVRRAGELEGFDPNEASAVEAARKLTCPLILVHGTEDWVVPLEHSREILQATAGPKRLIEVPKVGHLSIQRGRDEWYAGLIDELSGSPAATSSGPAGRSTQPAAP
jgi:pimeloyl-ACP methyl ester carboxylesterase